MFEFQKELEELEKELAKPIKNVDVTIEVKDDPTNERIIFIGRRSGYKDTGGCIAYGQKGFWTQDKTEQAQYLKVGSAKAFVEQDIYN